MFIYFKCSISNKQTISYFNQSSESSVGFGNFRRCGTLFYPSAVRCGAVQGFSNGHFVGYYHAKSIKQTLSNTMMILKVLLHTLNNIKWYIKVFFGIRKFFSVLFGGISPFLNLVGSAIKDSPSLTLQ